MFLANILSDCNFCPTSVEFMLHKIASVENQISAQLFIQNQQSISPAKGKYFSEYELFPIHKKASLDFNSICQDSSQIIWEPNLIPPKTQSFTPIGFVRQFLFVCKKLYPNTVKFKANHFNFWKNAVSATFFAVHNNQFQAKTFSVVLLIGWERVDLEKREKPCSGKITLSNNW